MIKVCGLRDLLIVWSFFILLILQPLSSLLFVDYNYSSNEYFIRSNRCDHHWLCLGASAQLTRLAPELQGCARGPAGRRMWKLIHVILPRRDQWWRPRIGAKLIIRNKNRFKAINPWGGCENEGNTITTPAWKTRNLVNVTLMGKKLFRGHLWWESRGSAGASRANVTPLIYIT